MENTNTKAYLENLEVAYRIAIDTVGEKKFLEDLQRVHKNPIDLVKFMPINAMIEFLEATKGETNSKYAYLVKALVGADYYEANKNFVVDTIFCILDCRVTVSEELVRRASRSI